MIITKLALPRRTFLRGMGATLALPLLDAMVPALSVTARTAARPTCRLGFIYIPNGVNLDAWRPAGEASALQLSSTLAPLEPCRDQLLVLSGLALREAESQGDGGGDHSRASVAWLSGAHAKRTEGAEVLGGTTADQIAAKAIGRDTVLPSLELATEQNDRMVGNCDGGYSCAYQNTISWRDPTTPMPMEIHPRVVFERLFGDDSSPAERLERLERSRSILDAMRDDAFRLQARIGVSDRRRIDQYLDAVRDVERRIQKAEAFQGTSPLPLPSRPLDIPDSF